MKRFACVFGIAALMIAAAPSMATELVNENFNSYQLGNLVGQGGWAAHSGAGNLPIQVVPSSCFCPDVPAGNGIQLVHGSGSREDASVLLGGGTYEMGAGDKLYAGFCVVVDGGDSDIYFAHFKNAATYFSAKTGITASGTDDFTFALFGYGTDAYPGGFGFGECHRVVTSYDFDSGISEMWIDPDCDLDENDPLQVPKITSASYTGTAAVAYAFRQSDANSTQDIDNLLVGTGFDEVCCPCIPEPSSLLLLALAGLVIRRR